MTDDSNLQQFISEQAALGVKDSGGSFTLNTVHALKKLAGFQLPEAHSWVLKIIQSAVASEITTSLSLKMLRSGMVFELQDCARWSLEDIETAMLSAQPGEDRALQHLVMALRDAAFNRACEFELVTSKSAERLVWRAGRLAREPNPVPFSGLRLTVVPAPGGEAHVPWARVYSDTTKAIPAAAFLCPIPLYFEGRRLDGLDLLGKGDPFSNATPFIAGTEQGSLPKFLIPGFHEEAKSRSLVFLEPDEPGSSILCSVYFHLQARWRVAGQGKVPRSELAPSHSYCHWVRDGIIIDSDLHDYEPTPVSVSYYIDSQGLETDLTSLRLQNSEARRNRMEQAARLVCQGLGKVNAEHFSQLEALTLKSTGSVRRKMTVFAVVITVLIPIVSPFVWWHHLSQGCKNSSDVRKTILELKDEVAKLRERL